MMRYEERADREAGGKFDNKDPITDPHEVLDLLERRDGDPREGRYIYIGEAVPEIHVHWVTEGDSGGDQWGTHYFLIDPTLIDKLKKEFWVAPKEEPVIGRTIIHDNKFVLSEDGEQELKIYLKNQGEVANRLRMKKKTCFSYTGSSRDNWQFGPLFFEFRNNNTGNRSRVYPASGKIVRVR